LTSAGITGITLCRAGPNNILKQHAQTLHLSGLLDSLQLRLQEAEANRLPYTQLLKLLFQDEINVRH